MPNYFNPSMVDDEDILAGLKIDNPEAGKIDNSPGLAANVLQAFLKAGATAAGGPAGAAAADAVSESYNASKAMPSVVMPEQMASVYTEKDRKLPVKGGTPMNFNDRFNFPNFVGPMQPDYYNKNSKYYGGLAYG